MIEPIRGRREEDGHYVIEDPTEDEAWIRSYGALDVEGWR